MSQLRDAYGPSGRVRFAGVAGGLMLLGFLSTLAKWPGDLPIVKVERNGMVREPTVAAPR